MKNRRALSLLLALLLCLSAYPVSAAETPAAASTMQLMRTEGTVSVTNGSSRSMTVRDNMRLYNGYHVETMAKSYAWINLDDTKLTKMDVVSEAEVRKAGKVLEILLNSGNLYFNVTSPLASDETLNIRTSTMVVGIRGTCGWVRVLDRWAAEIYVLEGTVECSVTDPVTGQVKSAELHGGDKAIATAYPQDREGDKCDIILERFGPGDIDGFVLEELARDPGLCGDIYEESGMDVLPPMGLLESIRRQLERIQDDLDGVRERFEQGDLSVDDAQSRLDDLRQQLEDLKGQLEQAGPDEDAQRRLDEAQEHMEQAQEALDNARSQDAMDHLGDAREDLENVQQEMADAAQQQGGETAQERREQDEQDMQDTLDRIEEELSGQENNVSSDPVWGEEEPEPESKPSTSGSTADDPTEPESEFRMYMTAAAVQQYLAEHGPGTYTLLPSTSGNAADNILTVNTDWTIPSGTALALSNGISIEIANGSSLTINGTLTGKGTLTNNGTLTVNSSNTLRMASIVNNGTLTNTASGHIVATDAITTSGGLTNAGTIESSILVNGGVFTITGGEVFSSTDYTVECTVGGTLALNGGTITNSGEGYALRIDDSGTAQGITFGNTDIRAAQSTLISLISTDDAPWDCTTTFRNGYYYLTIIWLLNDGTLAISGIGSMDNYTGSNSVPWYNKRNDIHTISIGDAVTSIGDNAFFGCSNLTSVTIPNSITSIGDYTFFECTSLTSVEMPDSITSIGHHTFTGCSSLTSMEIPDSVTSIGLHAFADCNGLTSVKIPGSIADIGINTFSNCDNLKSAGPISGDYDIQFGWAEDIPENAFWGCGSLESVTIPVGITSIGNNAFTGCSSLTGVEIPAGVTRIGYQAFESCTSLTKVEIPGSVTSIGANAFYGCSSLTDVYFGGTEADWEALESSSSSGNTYLFNASNIKCNSTGAEEAKGGTP